MHPIWHFPWYWVGIWLAGWWVLSILVTVVTIRTSEKAWNLRHVVYSAGLISLLWPIVVALGLLLIVMLVLVGIPAKILLYIMGRRDQRQHARVAGIYRRH